MPGEAPAGQVVVRLLDDDFNPLGEQTWPAWWLTHVRGIRRRRSSVVRRGPRIA
jgi:hypothetical protein